VSIRWPDGAQIMAAMWLGSAIGRSKYVPLSDAIGYAVFMGLLWCMIFIRWGFPYRVRIERRPTKQEPSP
jgi:hypothetical protein